uniref:DUF6503 family protein n=1 Tax=Daejeonella sp. TaxID=2805397 RepID=UPI003783D034
SLEFTFRNIKFKVMQNEGQFRYERTFVDSSGIFYDIIDNEGFKRFLNEKELKLDSLDVAKHSQSLNAMVYFLYLPLKLNDPSVKKKYIDEVKIKGKRYHKLEISFDQNEGGADHKDVYYYWFDVQDYSMDHFAYSSGGNRFRAVLKTHDVSGVIFQDYINYQMPLNDSTTTVMKYDSLFEAGKLRELSRIEFMDMRLMTISK